MAGKFRAANDWDVKTNIRRAELLALDVWRSGAMAICPHLNSANFQGAAPDSVWLEGYLAILSRCDAVITVEGWEQSEGARAEVALAREIGLPVIHSILELLDWLAIEAAPKQDWPAPYEKTLVIGFGHRARQGKDLAIKLLQQEYPGRVLRASFGDVLKSYCRVHLGMRQKDGSKLQQAGVAFRKRDTDVWVRAVAWWIAELDADARERQIVCIGDVRFPNETAFVERMGGRLCRVRRIEEDGTPFVAGDRDPNHSSEAALDGYPWPFEINAVKGDIETIRSGVRMLADGWL